MKKILVFLAVTVILFSLTFVIAEDVADTTTSVADNSVQTQTNAEPQNSGDEQQIQTQEKTETQTKFNVDAGLTPDNGLYFIDNFIEGISVGDNPKKALDAREEKIAEAIVMVEEGKTQEAQQVLDKALQYGDIIEREASPEMRERIEESTQQVQNVLEDLKEQAENQDMNLGDNFDENIAKEKTIGTAAELAAKIGELCNALAKLDPLQYADTCKSRDNSPKWIQEQDEQLTKEQKEQAKIFFDKLSQCFETPEKCDCKGMGVQSFEDFCVEKSSIAVKCEGGNEEACSEMKSGADPTELLPDYLISTFKKVESKYMKAEFDRYMPEECSRAGAKTAEECNQVMFKLHAPQECLEAGLIGKSREDEIKCKELMFKTNAPQECINAGINPGDSDAPRKCAKIMFTQNAPQECINVGLTGESSSDDKKCRQLMEGQGMQQGQRQMAPKFNKNCNALISTEEKMKCYEEFYNNAQFQVKEDFRSTGGQGCQSSQQIENLKQDCLNRGQKANVETRGGCPWVICIAEAQIQQTQQVQQNQQAQQFNPYGSYNPYVKEDRFGQKCPDGVCDDFEKANPYACPVDCGGKVEYKPPVEYQPPEGQQPPASPPEITTTPSTESGATSSGESTPSTETSSESSSGSESTPSTETSSGGETAPATGSAIFWNYYYKNK